MNTPDLSKLALNLEVKRQNTGGDNPELKPFSPLKNESRYRSAQPEAPPSKRAAPASEIVVHRTRLVPQPDGVRSAYEIWSATLETFGRFLLNDDAPLTEDVLEQWMRKHLSFKYDIIDYNTAMEFLGYYLALSIMIINASGPPDASWGGPIVSTDLYPAGRAAELYGQIRAASRDTVVRAVFDRICSGTPDHPFYKKEFTFFSREGTRTAVIPFIDTLGGIVDMTHVTADGTADNVLKRELLIATRRGEFMGHVFVTYASEPLTGVKGMMPYGIQRSAFYLPGTCMPPQDTSGFVAKLFGRIDEIAAEIGITHIFTWPLETMKRRFLNMGYQVVPKQGSEYDELKLVVESIYGRESAITRHIMQHEFFSWDFVMKRY